MPLSGNFGRETPQRLTGRRCRSIGAPSAWRATPRDECTSPSRETHPRSRVRLAGVFTRKRGPVAARSARLVGNRGPLGNGGATFSPVRLWGLSLAAVPLDGAKPLSDEDLFACAAWCAAYTIFAQEAAVELLAETEGGLLLWLPPCLLHAFQQMSLGRMTGGAARAERPLKCIHGIRFTC